MAHIVLASPANPKSCSLLGTLVDTPVAHVLAGEDLRVPGMHALQGCGVLAQRADMARQHTEPTLTWQHQDVTFSTPAKPFGLHVQTLLGLGLKVWGLPLGQLY